MASPSPRGVKPSLLLEQVRNTAGWVLEAASDAEFARALSNAPSLDATYTEAASRPEYLRVLLAAHYATVGTFVPTDVDTQIRHHIFWACRNRDELRALLPVVDAAATWDARLVSARTVDLGDDGTLAGHDGEWFSVRSGALGRALSVGDAESVDALLAAMTAELEREARALDACLGGGVRDPLRAARIVVTVAHNLGDLSRVVEAFPAGTPRAEEMAERFGKLGHEVRGRYRGVFVLAGEVNKAVMAGESHRYLPLRAARALRRSRDLLLPFPPFLDAWGEHLATALSIEDLVEVVTALLEGQAQYPKQAAWGRALRGMGERSAGGLERILKLCPARLRKLATEAGVRGQLEMDAERFEARFAKAFRGAVDGARARLRG